MRLTVDIMRAILSAWVFTIGITIALAVLFAPIWLALWWVWS